MTEILFNTQNNRLFTLIRCILIKTFVNSENCRMFVVIMRSFFKYLILLFLTVAFSNATEKNIPSSDNSLLDFSTDFVESYILTSSPSNSDFSLPRQISITTQLRSQSTIRRVDNFNRINFEFIKAGRIVNPTIKFLVQKQSHSLHSSLVEPANRLVLLCKYII